MWDPQVHVGTAVLVIGGDSQLLMLQRGKDCSHGAGQWSVPGGWVDAFEDTKRAAARELQEETDLHSDPAQMELVDVVTNVHHNPVGTVVCVFYKPLLVTGAPKIMEPSKTAALDWVTWRDALRRDLFAPFRSLLESGYRW